jgi:sulfite reductase (ferredoxin)
MTIKKGAYVMPALQILLGGGFDKDYQASTGDKIVKVPSKVAPDAFRAIMDNFSTQSVEGEYFNNFYQRKIIEDKMYFFSLLKPFTVLPSQLPEEYFVDWGNEEKYVKAIGVGECAGVVLDVVGTLIMEAEEKFGLATKTLDNGNWQDSIYHSYNSFVVSAKALLTGEGVKCNTQIGILKDFDINFAQAGLYETADGFESTVTQLKKIEPSHEFAKTYYESAKSHINQVKRVRLEQIERLSPES